MNLFSKIKKIRTKGSALISVVMISGIIGVGVYGMSQYMSTRLKVLEQERLNNIALYLNKKSIETFIGMISSRNPRIQFSVQEGVGYRLVDNHGRFGDGSDGRALNKTIQFTELNQGQYKVKFFYNTDMRTKDYRSASTTITLNTQDIINDGARWKVNVTSDIKALSDRVYTYGYDVLLGVATALQRKQSCAILVNTRGGNQDSIYGMVQTDCSPNCYNSAQLYIPGLPKPREELVLTDKEIDTLRASLKLTNSSKFIKDLRKIQTLDSKGQLNLPQLNPYQNNPAYILNDPSPDVFLEDYNLVHTFAVDAYNRCTYSNYKYPTKECSVGETIPATYVYNGITYQLLQDRYKNWFNDEPASEWSKYDGKIKYSEKSWSKIWDNKPNYKKAIFKNVNPCGGDCVCYVDTEQTSPLVIDLTGNGIRYTGYSNPLYFDFGTGSKIATIWLYNTNEAGFLALDIDNDGMIKTGKELFGNSKANNFKNGFEALKVYDTNKDNVIDNKDPVWNRLQVWNDLNRNAIGEKEELRFIKDIGIDSISLDYEIKREQPDPYNGSVSKQSSYAFKKDGLKLKVYDIYFMNVLNAEKLAKAK